MQASKRHVLETLNFGHRVAEDEIESLARYFVETDTWRQLSTGAVDVVYGAKGAGKSALYTLLTSALPRRRDNGVVVIACEEIRGATAFEELKLDPPTSEEEFRVLWLAYFLSLLAEVVRDQQIETAEARRLTRRLAELGLSSEPFSIRGVFRKAAALARRVRVEPELNVDPTGATSVKAVPRLAGAELKRRTVEVLLEALADAEQAFSDSRLIAWLALDRLDIAFADEPQLERNALRSLFRAYRALEPYRHIALKIFIRSDIWASLTRERFREATHITREVTLRWGADSLLDLVVRRILENAPLIERYEADRDQVLSDVGHRKAFFDRLFEQVSMGNREPISAFVWTLTRLADGAGQVAPRDLIHFFTIARDKQIQALEVGSSLPVGEALFSSSVYDAAFREVAVYRLQRSFFAEYPKLRSYVEAMEAVSAPQTLEDLQRRWELTAQAASEIAELLRELGILARTGSGGAVAYAVPAITAAGLLGPRRS